MNSITCIVALTLGLVLLLNITPSWSQPVCVAPGCNPTVSGANGNTAGGTNALDTVNAQGERNTAFGTNALTSTSSGDDNTAVGVNALFFNSTGDSNTAIGQGALLVNNSSRNTAIGAAALMSNVSGAANTGVGFQALQGNTTGTGNTACGGRALLLNSAGSGNTASGSGALLANTTGNNNTAGGSSALFSNDTGSLNTASGYQALRDNSAGSSNTAFGAKALQKSTGTKNIGIGYQAGVSLTTGSNNIYIGNQGAGAEFQTIRIGTAQAQTFIAGISSAGVSGPAVVVDANGQLGITLSSARYKRDIAAMGTRSAGVHRLRPVTFAYHKDEPGTIQYGLLAEDVAAVYPELVTHTATGEVQAVKYHELVPMLLNELQRQQQTLERQQQELAELRALVDQGRDTASLSR